ncbi:hypothetical protein BV378_05555 [Nostoc sp. RF31YmG]|nr:hypothetical protein BV378_05555 [Nostoc sp. RF31YmG]
MAHKTQFNQQCKGEISQESKILQRAAVRSVSDAGVQSTDALEAQPLSNSAFSKDFSRVPISTTKPQQIMAKLMIGPVGDKYEQEADRAAARVVQRINAPASVRSGEGETVQREEMETQDNEVKLMMSPILQRKSSNAGMAVTPDLEASINQARGGGQPMANSIRQPMEKVFGADFSGVKIHTNSQSDQLNQSIQARAFTTGQDVFFRQGEYNPGSRRGQELLAHELTHVVQQNKRHESGTIQRQLTIGNEKYSDLKAFKKSPLYEEIHTWLKEQIGKGEVRKKYEKTLNQYVSSTDVEPFRTIDHFKQNLLYDLRQGTWTEEANKSATLRYMTRRGWRNAVETQDSHKDQSISLYRTMPLEEARKIMVDKDITALKGHMGDYAAALDYCYRARGERVLVEFKLKAEKHKELFSPEKMAVVEGGVTTTHIRNWGQRGGKDGFDRARAGEGGNSKKVGVKSEEHGVAGFSLAAHGSVASEVLKPMIESIVPLLIGEENQQPEPITKKEFLRVYRREGSSRADA